MCQVCAPPAALSGLQLIGYADIPGWADDDHAAAFSAFVRSAGILLDLARTRRLATSPALLSVCRAALADPQATTGARSFFETHFIPHRLLDETAHAPGFLTGYYEPVIAGSRIRTLDFTAPIYRRPPDLVNLFDESERGTAGDRLTHARVVDGKPIPYATRTEIEAGALAGQGLELVWVADAVESFFVQVQGSACIVLADGEKIRITYDGKNGHPYTSVGRALVDAGIIPAADMSLQTLKDWLRADPQRGRDWMRRNASFAFFRELGGEESTSAHGVHAIPLTEGRSLAVDVGFHAIGTPVWVASPTLHHADPRGSAGFRRLMIAQDAGSAIRGRERGDIYFGSGEHAGSLAGITKHPGSFVVLLPNGAAP